MSTYGRIKPYCRLCPKKRHTPLPRSRSVVVEVTKIVDIDRPEAVIIDHVELVDPVLARPSHPKPKPQLPFLAERDVMPCSDVREGQTTKDQARHSHPATRR